jgi:hypothetical protein
LPSIEAEVLKEVIISYPINDMIKVPKHITKKYNSMNTRRLYMVFCDITLLSRRTGIKAVG